MSTGERLSFVAFFERHPAVCIPILQRDYAQGRAEEAEVRAAFLQALREALDKPEDDPTLPLDLDFVYGSLDRDGAFAPLDGQQRLTTLLLLHWYLATKDGGMPDFMRRPPPARGARFTYAVRPSSREFFDALSDWWPERRQGTKLSADIADQPWFFLSWKLDPTIQAALIMLDAIDARFADANGFYARLMSRDRPAITFQLLNLQHFGLSDDLYIKMNARGKPLTGFETFKALLEDHLDSVVPADRFQLHERQVGASEYLSHRIDTAWADVLWHYRDRQTSLSDDRFMNLVRAVVTVTRQPGEQSRDTLMQALRNGQEHFSFARYKNAGCLDQAFARTFMTLLDAWSGHEAGIRSLLPEGCAFDERAFVERLLKDAARLSYAELVQFGAYCGFLASHPPGDAQAFGEWMRVVVNLSANTPYDRLDDFTRSCQSVRDLLPHATGILSYLASPAGKAVKGFYGQQVREERIKASLLRREEDWRRAIEMAERHGYFAGQIEFLLDFAGVLADWDEDAGLEWSPAQETDRLLRFDDYRDKAFAIFASTGLRSLPQHLWERALLAHGDYLLQKGRNHSFLIDIDRDESWKRLLRAGQGDEASAKRKVVQAVFDRIDPNRDVEASLAAIVQAAAPAEHWRALLVRHPTAIAYCEQRHIRRVAPGRLYLLCKTRMYGEHAELLTYVLYRRLLAPERSVFAAGDSITYICSFSESVEPFISGRFSGLSGSLSVQINWNTKGLSISTARTDVEGAGVLPQGFLEVMMARGFSFHDGSLKANASLDVVESMLIDLALQAKSWDFSQAPEPMT